MDANRRIVVIGPLERGEMDYTYRQLGVVNPDALNDSEALHFLLCQLSPGDNYTVTFRSI